MLVVDELVLEASFGAATTGLTSLDGEALLGSDAALATEERPDIDGVVAEGRRELDAVSDARV